MVDWLDVWFNVGVGLAAFCIVTYWVWHTWYKIKDEKEKRTEKEMDKMLK